MTLPEIPIKLSLDFLQHFEDKIAFSLIYSLWFTIFIYRPRTDKNDSFFFYLSVSFSAMVDDEEQMKTYFLGRKHQSKNFCAIVCELNIVWHAFIKRFNVGRKRKKRKRTNLLNTLVWIYFNVITRKCQSAKRRKCFINIFLYEMYKNIKLTST